jgi:hypothetical protein
MAKGDQDRLVAQAADGLMAAHFRLPEPAALANTLIDYLQLACSGPYRIRLQGEAGQGNRQGATDTGLSLGKRRLLLEAVASGAKSAGAEGQNQAAGRVRSVIEWLRERQPVLWNRIEGSFAEALAGESPVSPADGAGGAAGDEDPRLLERIAERIRQSLDEYEQTGSPQELFLPGEPPRLRVVTVHQFFKGDAPFGRIVLTPSQMNALTGPGAKDEGECPGSLAAPLSQFPVAVRQCFESGFALYGDWSGGPEADFGAAVIRAVGLKADGRVPQACFIPCHVGGVAWTVSAIVTSRIDPEFAALCLRLYREWIPRVFEALRTSTQGDFLGWMLDSYQRGLARPLIDRSEINKEWARIRQNYPLPQWSLELAQHRPDDREMVRLPAIGGQTWELGRQGAANEYYRPAERLSQPASWGSGTLWGETLLERMREITSYSVQANDLQRLTAAQQSVASWAHDVKSYTSPIIGDLRSALRKSEESSPAQEPLRRALGAAMILNASSFAAQKILENRAAPSAETRIFLLPRRNSEEIVEATLQYLLQYWRSASPLPLKLFWDNELSERDALGLLASALRPAGASPKASGDEALLTRPAVVGVVALLREVVFNIRCSKPVAEPQVNIGHQTSLEPNRLRLTLEQRQEERYAWSSNPDMPKGLERANQLYGPDGAQLGHIVSHPPEQVRKGKGFSIKYVVEVAFNLAP